MPRYPAPAPRLGHRRQGRLRMRWRSTRGGLVLGGIVAVTVVAATAAYAVAWDNVTPYVNSGQSTASLQKLVWSATPAASLAAGDAAYSAGRLSADGSPGLAQVYSH